MGTTTEVKSARRSRANGSSRSGRRSKSMPGLDDWDRWCQHLQARRKPAAIQKLIPAVDGPILSWPLCDGWHGSESEKLVKSLERYGRGERVSHTGLPQRLEAWLDTSPGRDADPQLAMEAIAWCHAMPKLAECLPAAPWCQLLDSLQSIAEAAAGVDLLADPLSHQLLNGELPLTLSYVFPELDACRRLLPGAGQAVSNGLVELTDGEGLLAARFLSWVRPLLATWTRCGFIGLRGGEKIYSEAAQTQLDWLVLQSLRMCRSDGSQMLFSGDSAAYSESLFAAALALTDDPVDRIVASQTLPRGGGNSRRQSRRKLPTSSVASEWAEAAILRRDWTRQAYQLAMAYDDSQLVWELNSGGHRLWSGPANAELTVDGELLTPAGPWEEVCSVFDDDADYVELEMRLSHGRSLQRQIMLARTDRFLLVADVLLGEEESELEYRHRLPLAADVQFEPERDSREGTLVGKRRLARVLPLVLPEWRSERVTGDLEQDGNMLEYHIQTRGRRLYAPLFIDLDTRRLPRKLTWRRLTIAEHLETQPTDVAAAFRIQVGLQQWFIYRSLAGKGNRSALGKNVSCEFVVGRFQPNGEVAELVEIE